MHAYRPWSGLKLLALVTCCAWLLAAPRGWAQLSQHIREHMTPEMQDDAQLNDVFFLDADQGWAVGDRGVILHTEDGGRHWQPQRINTACRLESIHFIDRHCGWAVGGSVHPYTHRSSSVVAVTRDGGRTWTTIPDLTLPALKHVQFHNPQQGWAVGNDSALYPTGIFRTDDGGRSWVPIPSGVTGKWTAADFRDPAHGVVAGHGGNLAVVSAPQVAPTQTPDVGQRSLRAMRLLDGRNGWLVGDGGLAMLTADGGLSWQNPPGPLPPGVKEIFDFQALAVLGNHVWIAGSPGTTILHSSDAGRTWELFRTDHQVPLRSITFVDEARGWAVGDLGTILATRDGGRTWRRQRSGGTRVALLGVFSEADRVPLELFALFSGDEGYLGHAELLNRRDIEVPSIADAPLEDRANAALSMVGACGATSAWRFPLRQKGLDFSSRDILAIWDRVNDGQGVTLIEELVVRRIRQWRPEVIVTEAPSPNGEQPLSHLVNQVVLSAVQNAADPTSHPDHMTIAGLEPWAVKKVFCVSKGVDQATVRLTTAQLATRLGHSVAEQAEQGYAMVCNDHYTSPVTMGFQLLHDRLPQAAGRTNIFSGIFLQPGGEARRRQSQPVARNLDALTRAAQKRRNVEQIFELTSGPAANATAWAGQIQDLTKTLTPTSAGQVLYQLSQRYRDAGEMELTAQTLEQLVERYPHHPLSENALVWLVQYYASGEMAWQLRAGTRYDTRVAGASVVQTGMAQAVRQADYQQPMDNTPATLHDGRGIPRGVPLPPVAGHGQAVPNELNPNELNPNEPPQVGVVRSQLMSAGHASTAGAQFGTSDRGALAVHFAKIIQMGRPELFAEPWLEFPTAVAYRAQGMSRDAERFYHRLSASPVPSHWERCAQAELWLSHGRGKSPKPTYICRQVSERPRLDGDLSDAIWQQAERLELSSAQHDDGPWPAAAMLACDDQFLYLAISCRRVPGREYPETPGPRPRDPDLKGRDRVDLYLDLDRDYTTWYRLSVDHRGWTGESCMGNVHWDPTWYVASFTSEDDWTIEAAIPLGELAPAAPGKDDAWAFGMQRIVPGVGIQSFTQPAAVEPRGEGFALMVFQ